MRDGRIKNNTSQKLSEESVALQVMKRNNRMRFYIDFFV